MVATTDNKEKLKVLGNVIITSSHVDSILGALEKHSVVAHEDFFWQSQLRYYWEEQGGVGNLMIRQTIGYSHNKKTETNTRQYV